MEDNEGYLWIGTSENGLYKYDLKNKIYKNYKFNPEDSNSLSSNDISKIIEDSKGNLWISTYGEGLNKFDKKTETFKRFQHDSLKRNCIISDTIYHMVIDIDEKLWIGTPKVSASLILIQIISQIYEEKIIPLHLPTFRIFIVIM